MFGDKEKISHKIETLIGEKCNVVGSFSGSGLLKLDGSIEGDIHWEDDIILGFTSTCQSNICCKNAIISGSLHGNITCENILTIESSGKIYGDITVSHLIIKEGGMLDGKCTMKALTTSNPIGQ